MTTYIPDFVLNFQFNSLFGILLYWLPVAICLVAGALDIRRLVAHDLVERDQIAKRKLEASISDRWIFYTPSIKVGDVIGIVLVSFIPVVNLLKSVFYCVPSLFGNGFKYFCKFLNIPLVPK